MISKLLSYMILAVLVVGIVYLVVHGIPAPTAPISKELPASTLIHP